MRPSSIRSAIALIASTAAFASTTTLAADPVPSYGRAGGTVGAERIEQLTAPNAIPSPHVPDASKWYGRAGGAVGADRIDQLMAEKSTPARAYSAHAPKDHVVYGRAGVPLPFIN